VTDITKNPLVIKWLVAISAPAHTLR